LVLDAAPFPQQDGSRMKLAHGEDLRRPARNKVICNPFK
jgi:hypothetical protein